MVKVRVMIMMRTSDTRTVAGRLGRVAVVALVVAASVGVAGCGGSDADGTAVLTVVNLTDDVQGWRLRAEARSADLPDGSPTFYFSESEEVTGASMTSAETSLGARSYELVLELAEPSDETRSCEADLTISADEYVVLTVEAESLVESASEAPPPCSLTIERTTTSAD